MSDNKHIDRLFQEKFKNFEATPNDSVWKGIEAELKTKKKKRRVIPIWWITGGVAAALLLMLALNTGYFNSTSETLLPIIVDVEKPKNGTKELKSNSNKDNSIIASDNNSKVDATNNQSTTEKTSAFKKLTSKSDSKSLASKNNTSSKGVSNSSSLNKNNIQNTIALAEKNKKDETKFELKTKAQIDKLLKSKTTNTVVIFEEKNQKIIDKTTTEQTDENSIVEVDKNPEQSIEEAIAEANTLIEKEKKEDLNRWSIAPNIAPVYFNSLGQGSAIDQQFNNNTTTSDITMSYGIKGGYAINKRLKVTTGVNRVSFNNTTSNVITLSNTSFNTRSVTGNSSAKLQNVTLTNTLNDNSLTVMSKSNLLRSSIPEAINTLPTGNLDQRFGFIEIPLEVEYRVVDKKVGVNVVGGFSTLFLNENEIFADINGESTRIGTANNLSNTSFSANFGVGVDYNISKKLNVNLEPKFKYQINTFNNTSGNFQPFFIGIYTGLSFKF